MYGFTPENLEGFHQKIFCWRLSPEKKFWGAFTRKFSGGASHQKKIFLVSLSPESGGAQARHRDFLSIFLMANMTDESSKHLESWQGPEYRGEFIQLVTEIK